MPIITLVAVVDENNGLGKNNQLLCHLPADLKHFKQITLHHPIIMGRKTFVSIGKPLPHRLNIVISSEPQKDVITVSSLKDALQKAQDASEIMIIGGATVFRDAINIADKIYLTQIHHRFEADVFFPQLDPSSWDKKLLRQHPADLHNLFPMSFWLLSRLR